MFTQEESKEIENIEFVTNEIKRISFMIENIEYLFTGEIGVAEDEGAEGVRDNKFREHIALLRADLFGLIAKRIAAVARYGFIDMADKRIA